jgi:hypothetical protein
MPAVAAGAAIVGAGLAIYGDISSANDQANLDNERASIAQQQSAEIAARNQSNASILDSQAFRQKMQFGSSFAASGKSGVGVGSQLQIQNQADLQNMIATREANFQENMLQQQAGIDTTLASETEQAGTLKAIGAGVSALGSGAGAATSGGANPGYGGTQSLGAMPTAANNFGASSLTMPSLGAGSFGGG